MINAVDSSRVSSIWKIAKYAFLKNALEFKQHQIMHSMDGIQLCTHATVGQTPWKPILSKLKNHLKTFKMHQKVLTHLNFVYNSSKNDRFSKIVHAKVTCEVIFL